MNDIENSVKVSWQLVSQFVSWEFCRYMCEQSEKDIDKLEPDVLTFLRNMIVERTEKAASDITKHEIVAKFVMETRTIQKACKMPCIVTLAETLVRICPELKTPVATLVPRLEGLLRVLEWNEDVDNRELLQFSIVEAINDFTKEACKVLPVPDLPQVVEPWLDQGSQGQRPKVKYKSVANAELYQKALDCLQEEKITPMEAKIIAELLYEDKDLETLFLNISETETDIDSQPQSLSLPPSQQPPVLVSSQQLQLRNQSKPNSNFLNIEIPPVTNSLSLNTFPSPHTETTYKSPEKQQFHVVASKGDFQLLNKPSQVLTEPPHLELLDSESDFEDRIVKPSKRVRVGSSVSDTSPVSTPTQKRNHGRHVATESPRLELLDSEPEFEPRILKPSKHVSVDSDTSLVLTPTRKKIHRRCVITDSPPLESLDSEPEFEPRILKPSKHVSVDSETSPLLTATRKRNHRRCAVTDSPPLESLHSKPNFEDRILKPSKHIPAGLSTCKDNPLKPSKSIADGSRTLKNKTLKSSQRFPVGSKDLDTSPMLKAARKRNHERYLEFIQYAEMSSDDEINRKAVPDVVHSLDNSSGTLQYSILVSQDLDDGDTSDCDKAGEIRFLTPTIFKKNYVPVNPPAKVVWLSDQDSNDSSIVTDSQKNDPTFRTYKKKTAVCPSPIVPTKKPSKGSSKRNKRKQLQNNKSPKSPRQATLRGFGFTPAATAENPPVTRSTARKRPFKLFDNDMMPKNLDESLLFQKKEKRKKQTSRQKCEDVGNRRRCHECQKTFRTPLELKKHIFIIHTVEDLSD